MVSFEYFGGVLKPHRSSYWRSKARDGADDRGLPSRGAGLQNESAEEFMLLFRGSGCCDFCSGLLTAIVKHLAQEVFPRPKGLA